MPVPFSAPSACAFDYEEYRSLDPYRPSSTLKNSLECPRAEACLRKTYNRFVGAFVVIRDKYRASIASILFGVLLVLIGFAQTAPAQSYYVPGAPTPIRPVYTPQYAPQYVPQYAPQYAPQYVPSGSDPNRGAYFGGCCTPDPVISCEPDASGWTAAPSPATPTPDASGGGPTVANVNPYSRFTESQNMEPIRDGANVATPPSRAEFALSDDHPLLRPFQGTYGSVATTYASASVANPAGGAVASQDPGRDVSRPVEATTVSNPSEERSSVAWGGVLPPWMREPPTQASNANRPTPDAGPSRSANDVLERYGGVSRFDEPVLRR